MTDDYKPTKAEKAVFEVLDGKIKKGDYAGALSILGSSPKSNGFKLLPTNKENLPKISSYYREIANGLIAQGDISGVEEALLGLKERELIAFTNPQPSIDNEKLTPQPAPPSTNIPDAAKGAAKAAVAGNSFDLDACVNKKTPDGKYANTVTSCMKQQEDARGR